MAGNVRQWAKERLKSAVNHLEIAGEYLHEIHDMYNEKYPEMGSNLEGCGVGIFFAIEAISAIEKSL